MKSCVISLVALGALCAAAASVSQDEVLALLDMLDDGVTNAVPIAASTPTNGAAAKSASVTKNAAATPVRGSVIAIRG